MIIIDENHDVFVISYHVIISWCLKLVLRVRDLYGYL